TPVDGGAEWLTLVIKITSRADEATNNAGRRDMENLDRLRRSAYCVPRGGIMPPTLPWRREETMSGGIDATALGCGGLHQKARSAESNPSIGLASSIHPSSLARARVYASGTSFKTKKR